MNKRSFSLSGRNQIRQKSGNPAPGEYEPNQATSQSGFSMGKEKRSAFKNNNQNPGPGSYVNTKSAQSSGNR